MSRIRYSGSGRTIIIVISIATIAIAVFALLVFRQARHTERLFLPPVHHPVGDQDFMHGLIGFQRFLQIIGIGR